MKDALAISESGSTEGPRFGGGLRLSAACDEMVSAGEMPGMTLRTPRVYHACGPPVAALERARVRR